MPAKPATQRSTATLYAPPFRDVGRRGLLLTANGEDMKPCIKVLTLGLSDLERSLAFYRDGMGLPTDGIIGQEFEDGAGSSSI